MKKETRSQTQPIDYWDELPNHHSQIDALMDAYRQALEAGFEGSFRFFMEIVGEGERERKAD